MHIQQNRINAFLMRLPAPVADALKGVEKQIDFKKGAYLLKEGEVCHYSYFLVSGAARKFYCSPEGKEITTELLFSGDLLLSMKSYTHAMPSREYIQALADCRTVATTRSDFEALKKQFPVLTELELLLTEWQALWLEERIREMRTLDAAARYEKLRDEQPHIIRDIQLTHIAAYLGISLETLSRIRAKLG
jgi:CRP-like cAMP-binding protein